MTTKIDLTGEPMEDFTFEELLRASEEPIPETRDYPGGTELAECLSCEEPYKYRELSHRDIQKGADYDHADQLCAICRPRIEMCCNCNEPVVPPNDMIICDECFEDRIREDD